CACFRTSPAAPSTTTGTSPAPSPGALKPNYGGGHMASTDPPDGSMPDGTVITYGPGAALVIDPDCLVEEDTMATDPPHYNPEAAGNASRLAQALAAAQAELPTIGRNVKGQTGSREHRYADLAAVSAVVLPLLGKHGLSFAAKPTVTADGRFVLAYSLLHESGEREDGEYPLVTGTPQQLGSAITYGRRYCLCAITGAAPEADDDDGHAASQAPAPKTQQRKPRAEANGHLPKDAPGSAYTNQRGLITSIQIKYKELGFDKSERDQMLGASEQIIGRELTGPQP